MADVRELGEDELIRLCWESEAPFAINFFTPFCGTCRYGEKMLAVMRAIEPGAVIYKSNVNFMPTIVREWKIESVPCLAFVKRKRVSEKLYTLNSVDFLLSKVRELLLSQER